MYDAPNTNRLNEKYTVMFAVIPCHEQEEVNKVDTPKYTTYSSKETAICKNESKLTDKENELIKPNWRETALRHKH